jgi:hypothetical protein
MCVYLPLIFNCLTDCHEKKMVQTLCDGKTLQLLTFKFHANCNVCMVDLQVFLLFLRDDAVSNPNYTPPTGRTMDKRWIRKDLEAYYSDVCVKEECKNRTSFLGEFAILRKLNINFLIYVRLSVHIEPLGSHCTDFHEMWYLMIFRKYVEKIKVLT